MVQNPVALVFDEYDAGRPDVMFVIQRILEVEGKLYLGSKQGHRATLSFSLVFNNQHDRSWGYNWPYHGTQQINQGQMDRWSIKHT